MEDQTTTSSLHPPKKTKTNHPHTPPPIPSTEILIPSLPNELSIEILSRLPVKCLGRFTTISKSWHSLISSPHFTKTHLSTTLSDPQHSRHHLLFSTTRPHFTLHHFPLPSLLHNPIILPRDISYPLEHPDKSIWLVGSINGLVCIALDENQLIFWNPCLGKYIELPRLEIKIKRGCFVVYGFGYESRSDDYKVVGIFCVFKESDVYENEVKVYSRNNNSWKRIEGFRGGVPLDDSGKFVNGKLHWASSPGFVLSNQDNCRWSIVSIDVGNETYGEVEQPDYEEGVYDLVLGVLGGSICVLCNYANTRVDLWVMKEYGVRESWTIFASLSYFHEPEKYRFELPLCLLNNGEILLMFGSVFMLYNPKDGSQKFPEIGDCDACIEAVIYVESLVSPSIDLEQGRP